MMELSTKKNLSNGLINSLLLFVFVSLAQIIGAVVFLVEEIGWGDYNGERVSKITQDLLMNGITWFIAAFVLSIAAIVLYEGNKKISRYSGLLAVLTGFVGAIFTGFAGFLSNEHGDNEFSSVPMILTLIIGVSGVVLLERLRRFDQYTIED